MRARLLLFDLDETIAPDDETDRALFAELAAEVAAAHHTSAEPLVRAIVRSASAHWRRSRTWAYCRRVGISAWEGLWGPFGPSDEPSLAALHTFIPPYRLRVWTSALVTCGIHDAALAAVLAERFASERRARQAAYPWSREVLERLRPRFQLGMITNGAPDLQRLKLTGTGLATLFDPLVVSGDLGIGKPEPAIFATALRRADASPEETVMIGDSWQRDILGAVGAGTRAVWVNPGGGPLPTPAPNAAIHVIRGLRDLPDLFAGEAGG